MEHSSGVFLLLQGGPPSTPGSVRLRIVVAFNNDTSGATAASCQPSGTGRLRFRDSTRNLDLTENENRPNLRDTCMTHDTWRIMYRANMSRCDMVITYKSNQVTKVRRNSGGNSEGTAATR